MSKTQKFVRFSIDQVGQFGEYFWLHLQHPSRFPIYDQHVHRAMAFILAWKNIEIPNHNPQKIRAYLDNYLPFFQRFAEVPHRQADRGLWTFGKFLKSKYNNMVTSASATGAASISPASISHSRHLPNVF